MENRIGKGTLFIQSEHGSKFSLQPIRVKLIEIIKTILERNDKSEETTSGEMERNGKQKQKNDKPGVERQAGEVRDINE